MTYNFDIRPASISLHDWGSTFGSLSTKQFGLIYDYLDFPFEVTDDLRQLARDFTITFYTNMDIKCAEIATINLLEGTLSSDSFERKYEVLFANTFAYLEKMGYAEMIYEWETHSRNYYDYVYTRSLSDVCRLLRVWTVLEWLKQPISSEHALYSSDWDHLTAKWSPIYTRNDDRRLALISLSQATSTILQTVVLDHETRRLFFDTVLDKIETSPKTDWEIFALQKSKIKSEGRFRIDLREWKMIVTTLSDEEIKLLEQWALQHRDYYSDLRFPLPDFR